MSLLRNDSAEFRRLVSGVAAELSTVHHRDQSSFIRTPLMYPSGSSVVIRVTDAYPNYFVSDFGGGFDEAELIGGDAIYVRYAKNIAENAGIGFDQHSFFVTKASRDQLAGAVATTANCSQEAATLTAYRVAERKYNEASDILYKRLVSIFSEKIVSKDVEIVGSSTTKWNVSALVKQNSGSSLFEPVNNHHNSIFAVATKFHDIGLREKAPRRVSVVSDRSKFKSYLAVLTNVGDVIEKGASNETFREIADAA